LIEAPKERLREIQKKILHGLLDKLPVHEAAHGCVRGRSTRTHAQAHAGAAVLVHMDLSDFFTSIRASRVHALFRTLGYSQEISRSLTGLLTHCTSPSILRMMPIDPVSPVPDRQAERARMRGLLSRHLPQGAPSSPALANLCAWRLDLRLAGAAKESEARYTRYVDDLVVSCPPHTRYNASRIILMVQSIIIEEGFIPHPRKTRLSTQAQAQRVTGLIVNVKPNVPRADYDRLKAILTNCVRYGPASQNRGAHADFRAHLWGRVSYVRQMSAARGARLAAVFGRIDWASC
jgi:RNA-directed DNA polymerase